MAGKSAFTLLSITSIVLLSVFSFNALQLGPKKLKINPEPMETLLKNTSELHTDLTLSYLVKPANNQTKQKKALILLHGVGSNEQDLFSLASYLPENFLVVSPRGPITVASGSYAWYQVDFSTGKPVYNKLQEEASRQAILKFVQEVKQKYKLDEIYIGGFSQGAIMSFSIGLTNPSEVKGVLAFSGRILEDIQSTVISNDELHFLKVFIAHGVQDGTLPITYARQAKAFLQNLGVSLTYNEYNMGHQINGDVLNDVDAWLKAE